MEMLLAHLKRIVKLDRLRLRGLTSATDEFTLAATVQTFAINYHQESGFWHNLNA